jgi:hypothetical protein
MRFRVLIALGLGFALAPRVGAHEGGTDARGVVKAITGDEIVVTTPSGAEVKAAIVPGTEIVRGKEAIGVRDVHPGERVVLHAAPHEGRLEAKLVKVADDKKT